VYSDGNSSQTKDKLSISKLKAGKRKLEAEYEAIVSLLLKNNKKREAVSKI
jgi:hypothetical protein